MNSFPEREEFTKECREMTAQSLLAYLRECMRQIRVLRPMIARADVSPKKYYAARNECRDYEMYVEVVKMVICERIDAGRDEAVLQNFWKHYAEWLEGIL